MIGAHEQAEAAFISLHGRKPCAGRDDAWESFKSGWNTAILYSIAECTTVEKTVMGDAHRTLRRKMREVMALLASAKFVTRNKETS